VTLIQICGDPCFGIWPNIYRTVGLLSRGVYAHRTGLLSGTEAIGQLLVAEYHAAMDSRPSGHFCECRVIINQKFTEIYGISYYYI